MRAPTPLYSFPLYIVFTCSPFSERYSLRDYFVNALRLSLAIHPLLVTIQVCLLVFLQVLVKFCFLLYRPWDFSMSNIFMPHTNVWVVPRIY